MHSSKYPRRTILKGLAAGSLAPLLGANLIGCSDSNDGPGRNENLVAAAFDHGVASGDPLQDRLIIWTRATPEQAGDVRLDWEVAADRDFTQVVASGSGTTHSGVDYTMKVDVEGLTPASDYYFRFRNDSTVSPTGHGRTLPVGAVSAVSFAVVSCSNYPAGYFNVYREVAGREVDAVLHLGDYIYEYGRGGYASDQAAEFDREVIPATEIIALDDYRARYAQYRTDPDLQAAHAAHSFIVVWDDHEITNNTYKDGAQNHDEATEGSFEERKLAAIQAWYEWLPVRPPAADQGIIYRRFEYGDLVNLLMLDTRLIGRDEQLSYDPFASDAGIDDVAARAAFNDSNRTILGAEQLEWLKQEMTGSNQRWQVLGQQVIMARQSVPAPIIEILQGIGGSSIDDGVAALLQSVAANQKPAEERTEEEQALLDSAIPLNTDAWDGYGFERDDVLNYAQQSGLRVVALAGDTHNSWASQLTSSEGVVTGVEFAAPSVTSPGQERALGPELAAGLGSQLPLVIDDLVYTNLVDRGFMTVTFSQEQTSAQWHFISTIDSREYTVNEGASLAATADSLLLSS